MMRSQPFFKMINGFAFSFALQARTPLTLSSFPAVAVSKFIQSYESIISEAAGTQAPVFVTVFSLLYAHYITVYLFRKPFLGDVDEVGVSVELSTPSREDVPKSSSVSREYLS